LKEVDAMTMPNGELDISWEIQALYLTSLEGQTKRPIINANGSSKDRIQAGIER